MPHRRASDDTAHLGPPTLGDVLGIGRDLHSEIARVEERVIGEVQELRVDFEGFQVEHRDSHQRRTLEVDDSLRAVNERLNAYDLEQARRQGALGVLRWTMDLLGRNWKAIATLALAIATFLGNIRVEVVAR